MTIYSGIFKYTLPTSEYDPATYPYYNAGGSFTTLIDTTSVVGSDTLVEWEFVFDSALNSSDGLVCYNIFASNGVNVHITDFGGIPLSKSGSCFKNFKGTFPADSANSPSFLPGGSLQSMIQGCTNFNQQIDHWDISGTRIMNNVFANATSFNQPINSWDTSLVYTCSLAFANTLAFNQPLDAWDVSNITTMTNMFSGSAFNQPINNWNTSKVTNTSYMFNNTLFNKPLNNWDV